MSDKKLTRPNHDRKIAGVCAGLGNYFGIDPNIIRILFVLFFLFAGGGILIYLVLWIVMPQEKDDADVVGKNITEDVDEVEDVEKDSE